MALMTHKVLKKWEKFFINQKIAEGDKVGLLALHLLGEAQLWFGSDRTRRAN